MWSVNRLARRLKRLDLKYKEIQNDPPDLNIPKEFYSKKHYNTYLYIIKKQPTAVLGLAINHNTKDLTGEELQIIKKRIYLSLIPHKLQIIDNFDYQKNYYILTSYDGYSIDYGLSTRRNYRDGPSLVATFHVDPNNRIKISSFLMCYDEVNVMANMDKESGYMTRIRVDSNSVVVKSADEPYAYFCTDIAVIEHIPLRSLRWNDIVFYRSALEKSLFCINFHDGKFDDFIIRHIKNIGMENIRRKSISEYYFVRRCLKRKNLWNRVKYNKI